MPSADNKRIAKNTIFLYLRMAFIMGISLYTSRVVLEKLGVADFGLYNVIGGVVVMLSFIGGALSVTTQRFLSFELGRKDFRKLQLTFSQSVYVHLLIGLIAVILAETAGLWFVYNKMTITPDKMNAAIWVYQLSIISFLISFIQVPYRALITAYEEMNIYAIIGIVEAILLLATAIAIGYFSADRLIWYALLRFFAVVIVSGLYCSYCIRKYYVSHLVKKIHKPIFKELVSFAGFSVFGSLAWTGKNQGVNIILNMFYGTIVNAAYSVANQVNVAVNSFVQNFTLALNPQIIKAYAGQDYARVNLLLKIGGRISFMLLFLLAFPIMVAIDGILDFWLVETPEYTAVFIQLILVVSLLESFTFVMGTALQATGKIKVYQIVVGLTIILNLPISWVCLKYGMSPSSVMAIAIIIASITLFERMIILKRLIPGFSYSNYSINVYLRAAAVVVVSISLLLGIQYCTAFDTLHWCLKSMICVAIAACGIYIVGITHPERNKINLKLYKLIFCRWKR